MHNIRIMNFIHSLYSLANNMTNMYYITMSGKLQAKVYYETMY